MELRKQKERQVGISTTIERQHQEDFYGKDEPVYPIERINLATGKSFEDGVHILYVNGEQASDMNFELMADRTRYLKENPKEVTQLKADWENI